VSTRNLPEGDPLYGVVSPFRKSGVSSQAGRHDRLRADSKNREQNSWCDPTLIMAAETTTGGRTSMLGAMTAPHQFSPMRRILGRVPFA
jgi:hypothetical protein